MKFDFGELFKGKRKNENLVLLIVILIIVVVVINYIWKDDNKKQEDTSQNQVVQVNTNNTDEDLETKLEDILSKISGVGRVKVMITYLESSSVEPIYDENSKVSNTTEADKDGTTRTISQTDNQRQIIYKENSDGSKEPITKSILNPKIAGAIIAASGAADSNVKAQIVQAVEAATGLATHKIQVFQMEEK